MTPATRNASPSPPARPAVEADGPVPMAPVAMVTRIGDAERAADLVAGRVQARQHARLVVGGAGEHGQRHRDQRDAESQARDEHARQDIAEVAAIAVDAGQQQHPGGGQRERDGHGDPQAGVTDEVAAEMRAEADDDGHRQEREPGLQRAGAEHLLQVDRGEQERAEQDRGRGQHHHEAAADAALAEPRDVEQGPAGVQLQCGERGEAGQAGEAEAERLHATSSRRRRPARGRRRAPPGSRWRPAAPRRSRPRHCGRATSAGTTFIAADGDADADGQVDEEDGAPVDELGERPAQQDADGGAGAADGAPDAERLRAVGTLEGGRDDRQRGRRQHRCPQTLSGAGGEEDCLARRQRRGERGDGEHAEAGRGRRGGDRAGPRRVRRAAAGCRRPASSS